MTWSVWRFLTTSSLRCAPLPEVAIEPIAVQRRKRG